jgi:hypothetical protein
MLDHLINFCVAISFHHHQAKSYLFRDSATWQAWPENRNVHWTTSSNSVSPFPFITTFFIHRSGEI